jgi:Flp pilus assembly protein TadG
MPTQPKTSARGERGQILVLFALGAIAMIAMVGLVLDGGDTFAQRRDQQNGADLAALAGANAYLNTYTSGGSVGSATTAARNAAIATATQNGYTAGGRLTVSATVSLLSAGAEVTVDITKPHQNNFARVMGFETWDVSVTATAQTGAIDTGVGAAPWIMNIGAFNPNGTPKYDASNPIAFGEANGDYPISGEDLAWTDFNGSNNVNTNEVRRIITGDNVVTATIGFDQYIGQHNQGNHTALYGDVNSYLAGVDVPIPIVGPCPPPATPNADGCFKGWAMFHVISASGGSDKTITGYFLTNFIRQPLTVGECTAAMQAAGTCGRIPTSVFGAYAVRLSN